MLEPETSLVGDELSLLCMTCRFIVPRAWAVVAMQKHKATNCPSACRYCDGLGSWSWSWTWASNERCQPDSA